MSCFSYLECIVLTYLFMRAHLAEILDGRHETPKLDLKLHNDFESFLVGNL